VRRPRALAAGEIANSDFQHHGGGHQGAENTFSEILMPAILAQGNALTCVVEDGADGAGIVEITGNIALDRHARRMRIARHQLTRRPFLAHGLPPWALKLRRGNAGHVTFDIRSVWRRGVVEAGVGFIPGRIAVARSIRYRESANSRVAVRPNRCIGRLRGIFGSAAPAAQGVGLRCSRTFPIGVIADGNRPAPFAADRLQGRIRIGRSKRTFGIGRRHRIECRRRMVRGIADMRAVGRTKNSF